MPGAHQITAGILTGAHQVAGGFLVRGWHRHRGELVQARQPRQVDCVAGIGLDPVPAGTLQFRGCEDLAPNAAAVSDRASPNPVGPASYATATGPGKSPSQDRMSSCDGVSRDWMSSPATPSIAAATTDRACTSSPRSYAQ